MPRKRTYSERNRVDTTLSRMYSPPRFGIATDSDFGMPSPPPSSSPAPEDDERPRDPLPLGQIVNNATTRKRTCRKTPLTPTRRPKAARPTHLLQQDPAGSTLVQSKLNLLPARVHCKGCGMSYTRTDPDDCAMHDRFHRAQLEGVLIPSKTMPAVATASVFVTASGRIGTMHGVRLAIARAGERAVVARTLELVDIELASTLPPLTKRPYTAFLYRVNGRCVALALCEPVAEKTSFMLADDKSLSTRKACTLGVSRMWTCKVYRRKGLMRELLDLARARYLPGALLDKSDVAYTQLSASGEAFLHAYNDGEPVYVYAD
ncbi:Establishment of cohesion 1 [Savitreella phatthalungensis]